MNEPPLSTDELYHLFSDVCNGALSDAAFDRLQRELRTRPEVRAAFIEYRQIDSDLKWEHRPAGDAMIPAGGEDWVAGVPGEAENPAETAAGPDARPPILGFLGATVNWVQTSPRTLVLTIAAALVGYFLIVFAMIPLARWALFARPGEQPGAAQSTIGTLASDADARQSDYVFRSDDAPAIAGKQYTLSRGRVVVNLDGGTRIIVEGPSAWQLESQARMQLRSGRIVAQVPPSATGFTVVTPVSEIVDLGTEFGVEVDTNGQTDIHVLLGEVQVKQTSAGSAPAASPSTRSATKVAAGKAVRVTAGTPITPIPVDRKAFAGALTASATHNPNQPLRQVWLGNLFDDRPHIALEDAMRTDTFGAEADANDLGVDRVAYGGPPLVEIAPNITFDLGTAGWEPLMAYKVANDGIFIHGDALGGLRLAGYAGGVNPEKIEEGIGMHANSLLTFSLSDIRAAWKQEGQPLQFVCDAVGVSDIAIGPDGHGGTAHLIVLVSSRAKPLTAIVDGVPADLGMHDGHPFVQSPIGTPVTGGGTTFRVRCPLGPDAEYLTLVCTSAGDGYHGDHGTWIGARLEVAR